MPIRSHTTPRAYLQRFATPAKRGEGKLWVYERGKPPRQGTPKSEGTERGFFLAKLQNGTFDDRPAEEWAQQIEDRALEALIHAQNPCFVWTDNNRKRMAEYWALLFVRANAAFRFHRATWEKHLAGLQDKVLSDAALRRHLARRYSFLSGRNVTEEEIVNVCGRVIPNLRTEAEMRSHYVQRLQHRTAMFSSLLLDKQWQIWVPPDTCEFVTCDSPVMTLRFDQWGRYYVGDGFGRDGVVALLPLSPKACLLGGLGGYPTRTVADSDVWEINKVLVSSCSRFTYSKNRDDRIDALVQERAGSIRYGVDAFRGPEVEALQLLL